MISLSSLTKHFGSHTVLKDVSPDFPAGTVTAVIGPNGSGKTTLMKSILGLITPSSGSIEINGVSAINNSESRQNVGYMAQIARYPENLSAQEVIDMVRGLRQQDVTNEMERLIETFSLESHLNKPMRALSGGTRQKVGAVIALMYNPSVLLLDEPTAGLDPVSANQLKKEIIRCKEAGASVVITSHILTEIQQVADRLVYVSEGSIVFNDEISALLEQSDTTSLPDAIDALMGAKS